MKKILFIDDNSSLLEEIADALQFEGIDVLCANGGKQGIELAKKHNPDLILCDIKMVEIDGTEVCRQLKRDPDTAMIPFIFLTALAEPEEIQKGLALGADDYLIKPVSLEDLLKAIK